MRYLFADETNDQPAEDVDFFIYGGLVLTDKQMVLTHRLIEELRIELRLEPAQPLKFASAARPTEVARDDWTRAKRRVLGEAVALDVKFLAYAVHHRVAAGQNVQTRNEYAVNTLLYGFHKLLVEEDDHGMVIFDEPDFAGRLYLSRLINTGLDVGGRPVRMPRIVSYSRSHVDWSHSLSACDVVLGAFRYCVNHPDRPVAREMFPAVASLMHFRESDDGRLVREHGLFLRPRTILSVRIRRRYADLTQRLQTLANENERAN